MAPRARQLINRLRGGGIATETAWGFALELLQLFTSVLSFLFLGRSLGAAGYGGYASLYAIVGPLVTLAASGVVLAVMQHIVRDREDLAETARSCLTLSIALGVVLTLVGTGMALLIVETVTVVGIVSILVTEFVTAPAVQVAASVVQAGTGFIPAARFRLVFLLGRLAVLVVLFATDTLSVATLGVSMLLVSTILAIGSIHRVGRRYGFTFVPGRPRWQHLKTNALYSTAISAAALNSDGDKLVLAANGFVVDTGLYAAAYRIVSFGMLPVGSLVNVSHRRFLHHEEGVARQHLDRSVKFGLVSGLYGLAFGILIFIAAPFLPLIMGDEFEGSVVMVRWLSPTILMRSLAIFPLNGLMGLGRTGLRTVIVVLNAAFAMGLYIVLVPIHGWEGAAIGTLITETVAAVSAWIAVVVCQRRADLAHAATVPV
jgi:O-antigen/teichoic acid export membrane protein